MFGVKHTARGFGHEHGQRVRCGDDLGAIGALNLYGSLLGCTAGGLPLPLRIASAIVHIRHICHLSASPACWAADLLALYGILTQSDEAAQHLGNVCLLPESLLPGKRLTMLGCQHLHHIL